MGTDKEDDDNFKYFDKVKRVFTNTPNENTIEIESGYFKKSSIQRLRDKKDSKKEHSLPGLNLDEMEEISAEPEKTEKGVEAKFDKYGRWINPNFKNNSGR